MVHATREMQMEVKRLGEFVFDACHRRRLAAVGSAGMQTIYALHTAPILHALSVPVYKVQLSFTHATHGTVHSDRDVEEGKKIKENTFKIGTAKCKTSEERGRAWRSSLVGRAKQRAGRGPAPTRGTLGRGTLSRGRARPRTFHMGLEVGWRGLRLL